MKETTKAKLVIFLTIFVIVGSLKYYCLVSEISQLKQKNLEYKYTNNNYNKKVGYYEASLKRIFENSNKTITYTVFDTITINDFWFYNSSSPIVINLDYVDTLTTLTPKNEYNIPYGSYYWNYLYSHITPWFNSSSNYTGDRTQ